MLWNGPPNLFAEMLRRRLHLAHGDGIGDLHGRASRWLEEEGLVGEAIGHALAAEDSNLAAALIEQTADRMWMRGGA